MRDDDRPAYLVNAKLFCFHRVPRKDAVDAVTGERLDDVLAFRLADEGDEGDVACPIAGPSSSRPIISTVIPGYSCASVICHSWTIDELE
jgi:hypothetical protein